MLKNAKFYVRLQIAKFSSDNLTPSCYQQACCLFLPIQNIFDFEMTESPE